MRELKKTDEGSNERKVKQEKKEGVVGKNLFGEVS